jgi:hypothetical protein
MTTPPKGPQSGSIQVTASDEASRGRYSNSMLVTHTPEEFILDWLINSPTGAHLVARVVVSPGHMKRILAALGDNIRKYEDKYGAIKTPDTNDGGVFH